MILIIYLFRLQLCFWNHEVLTPIQKYGMVGPGRDAFKKLKLLLDRVMLRRTKANLIFESFPYWGAHFILITA